MMRLEEALRGVARLGVDTSPVIYFIEAYPKYDPLVTEIFRRIDQGVIEAASSVLTLTEVLVQTLRKGSSDLKDRYVNLLTASHHFSLTPIDAAQAAIAADLRARYNLRIPDAFQVAAAISSRCDALLTNDSILRRIKELPVFVLDDLSL